MPDISFLLVVTLLLVLAAEFVNGWTDAPNAIATVVSTRVLSPSQAVVMAAVSPFAGRLSDRLEPRIVASVGMGLTVAGLLCLLPLFNLRFDGDVPRDAPTDGNQNG